MAKIKGIEGMSLIDINNEVQNGGKFVFYKFTISVILMTFRNPTDIYFIKSNESATVKGLGYTLITFLLGWWGIPWGPIYSIGSIVTNLSGGTDVTKEVLASFMDSVKTEVAMDLDGDGDSD